ncbi:MAG: indole-3-glycerol phosphate synthase [Candidatus Diapherotrites archaeon]|uniref:Indole-3-glycerol phosphate synthase n=1 Tax=Candidatus Iainarchaeum sp. TaxID=3101447 RepID=A0A2D6M145_9ARCH|nr:indole-3-glycerol phosphate synthase [Candidatus Diapherotrites archaeon]|tara:strand:- start:5505 stop:6275 length:771 start_codon:yes stop_codon:yes gene_type:complete
MKGIIRDILEAKKKEVVERKKQASLSEMMERAKPTERNFKTALESKKHAINLIAEIKRASPSAGVIRENFDLKEITALYDKHAQAISVLTDEKFFQGSPDFIKQVKEVSQLPVLRKDFVIDEYQLYESLVLGADAVLLIASMVSKQHLQKFIGIAKDIGLATLVEVHSSQDFERAFSHNLEIIGVNNRDLETMKVNLNTFTAIKQLIPSDRIVVAESGYNSKEQIDFIKGKADAVLIGSAFMKASNMEEKLVELGF